jgi:magnesium transporter
MIAGIEGMNFQLMPELQWSLGYPIALALMVATSVGLFIAFKRSRWL